MHQAFQAMLQRRSGTGAARGVIALIAIVLCSTVPAGATTLQEALSQAYRDNPTLNAERARVRSVDENVPQAKSGYRPTVSATADIGREWTDTPAGSNARTPRGYGISIEQPLFRGFRTKNSISRAEAQVLSARQSLADVEQNVLLDAVTAYMDVLNTRAIVSLRQRDVAALREQVEGTQARFEAGEATRTDIAQGQARLSLSRSQLTAAQAQQFAAEARYVQVIGSEPRDLRRPPSIVALLPNTLVEAKRMAAENHPAILAAEFAVIAAEYQVKVAKGELLPTASVEASYNSRWDSSSFGGQSEGASIIGRVNVPLYQGGVAHSRTRQAKEDLARAVLETDIARRQIEANVVSAWESLKAARQQIQANRASLDAAQLALDGIREEFRVGQRSTIDVLDAQREVVTAQIALVQAQRDEVVAAYALLAATGQLNINSLQLAARAYNPEEHYQQVKNRWFGINVPAYDFER